jgi:hypothetical protein
VDTRGRGAKSRVFSPFEKHMAASRGQPAEGGERIKSGKH